MIHFSLYYSLNYFGDIVGDRFEIESDKYKVDTIKIYCNHSLVACVVGELIMEDSTGCLYRIEFPSF